MEMIPNDTLALPYTRVNRLHSLQQATRNLNNGSPSLAEKQEDRRDKRTRVTDTNPPNEVGDIPAPAYGTVNTPWAYTPVNLPCYRKNTETKEQ